MAVRPGYGVRHPDVEALLARRRPAMTSEVAWADGALPLRVGAYCEPAELPEVVLTSIRCIVLVGDQVLVCDTPDGCHPWPGGRREPGETPAETACREVHEETGWILDRVSVEPIGWLHLECLRAQPEDHPYPHPDFLQLVCLARATHRDEGPDVWVDTEGWEQASRLVPLDEAVQHVGDDMCASVFLELVRQRLTG